jgi:hypothetical protein
LTGDKAVAGGAGRETRVRSPHVEVVVVVVVVVAVVVVAVGGGGGGGGGVILKSDSGRLASAVVWIWREASNSAIKSGQFRLPSGSQVC